MSTARNNGLLAIVGANVIFGLNVPVTKALMAHWMSPLGYTLVRMLFGTMVFWSIGLFRPRERVARKDLLILAVGGLLGYLGTQFLFSLSLRYTTPVTFSLLMALTPVVVLFLSAFLLREELPARKVIGAALSMAGASAMILWGGGSGGGGAPSAAGVVYALLCVLCYAAYLVLTRRVSVRYAPVTVAKWMFLFSAMVVLPFTRSAMEQGIFSAEAGPWGFALLAFALLFSTTLAFFLMPLALKKLEASTVSVFMNLQPIVASVAAIGAGQDRLTWDKPLAALLVLAGVYLVSRPAGAPGGPHP